MILSKIQSCCDFLGGFSICIRMTLDSQNSQALVVAWAALGVVAETAVGPRLETSKTSDHCSFHFFSFFFLKTARSQVQTLDLWPYSSGLLVDCSDPFAHANAPNFAFEVET